MANKKKEVSGLIETDDQPATSTDVRKSLANQASQTGQNNYEYTDRDAKDAERRSGLGE